MEKKLWFARFILLAIFVICQAGLVRAETSGIEVKVPYAATTADGWWTGIAIQNIDYDDSTEDVIVKFNDAGGDFIAEANLGPLSPLEIYTGATSNMIAASLPASYSLVVRQTGCQDLKVTVFVGNFVEGGFAYQTYSSRKQGDSGVAINRLPYTINQGGSYFLTHNMSSSGTAISIAATNVTLDLKGHTITGPGQSSGEGIHGIDFVTGSYNNVEVKNGTVRGFGEDGIHQGSGGSKNISVVNIRALENGRHGIYILGYPKLIKDCFVSDNSENGIMAGGHITGNIALFNGGSGIKGFEKSVISENISRGNGEHGIMGDQGTVLKHNSAVGNGRSGITAGRGSTVIGNTAFENDQYGILLAGNAMVDQNCAYDNNQEDDSYTNIESCPSCTFGTNHAP